MNAKSGTGARKLRLLASLAAAGALVASGVASGALAQDPSPTRSGDPPVIHGWVGTRAAPAGLYSWTVGEGLSWMHRVPEDWNRALPNSVELTIEIVPDVPQDAIPVYSLAAVGTDLEAPDAEVRGPAFRVWIMDIDTTKVAVVVKAYTGTSPELVAEAEAIVRSMYLEPEPAGTGVDRRIVFAQTAGWDAG